MQRFFFIIFFVTTYSFSQENIDQLENLTKDSQNKTGKTATASIDQYQIISISRDTTYVDTSLTIKKEYEFNYLRKDIFGLVPFPNEGQTYTTLFYGLKQNTFFPSIGFKGKHFNYLEANDINYYSVATPFTDLYFKTVMEQGQNLDAFATVSTSKRFNFSIAYKGLRSLGKYINQLSSTGNFRFTTNYSTKNNKYSIFSHFTSQDILNGENGGITNLEDFEGEDTKYKNRARINVFLTDATSFLKGKRFFIDHNFFISDNGPNSKLYLTHQFNFENKFFEYNQPTIASSLVSETGVVSKINRFGSAYVASNINNQLRYNKLHNRLGIAYENLTLGKFQFFTEEFRYNYFYNSVLFLSTQSIPNSLNDQIQTIGGQYDYKKNKWNGKFSFSKAISNHSIQNLDALLSYRYNEKNSFSFQFQNTTSVPDNNYNLNQSSYVSYNWFNSFKNEKVSQLNVNASTQWLTVELKAKTINDLLYYSNDDENLQLVSPKQYGETINYISIQASKEFKYRNFALDNTFLYQKVDQQQAIINVPQIVTRNTLYYSTNLFKKAMYLQTGIIFNYFTRYFADDYNPIIGGFFVQNQKEIGNYPNLDFFINARVQRTRIYLKAEHFNSSMSGNNFYSAPNNPYRDFIVRFGLVWNFFN
jgi:hypothetical protein